MRGAKPQAIETRSASRSKRELPDRVVVGGRGAWAEPTHLDPRARAVWDELVPPLLEAGVLDRIDRAAFELMCTQFSRADEAREALDNLDTTIGDLDERLADDRALLDRLKDHLKARLAAQADGMQAARVELIRAVDEGSSAEVLTKITGIVNRLESASVTPAELAAITKLETTLVSLDEFLRLRATGYKVALGSTGQIVAHPLLAEERAAASLVLRFGEHYAATPVARARLGLAALQGKHLKSTLDEELGIMPTRRPIDNAELELDGDAIEDGEVTPVKPRKRKPTAAKKTPAKRKPTARKR